MSLMECTDAGRAALQNRSISARERQILLLATGGSSSRRMLEAMGAEARAILASLQRKGLVREQGTSAAENVFKGSAYLMEEDTRIGNSTFGDYLNDLPTVRPRSRRKEVGYELNGDMAPASSASVPAAPAPQQPATPASAAASEAAPMRSLQAGRLYVMSMLGALHKPAADNLREQLRRAASEDEQISFLLLGAEYFCFATKPELGSGMLNKLRQLVPESLLEPLDMMVRPN